MDLKSEISNRSLVLGLWSLLFLPSLIQAGKKFKDQRPKTKDQFLERSWRIE